MYQIDFHKPLHIHLIGIGGISMSGIAEILLEENFRISGSDTKASPLTRTLEERGAVIYYGQRARGGSAEETGRLILRVNDLPAGGKLTMSAAEYRLAKAALNQLRTQRLAEGGYTDAVDDALTRLLHAHTPLFIW